MQQIIQLPFVQIALPIIVALTIAAWNNSKRIEDLKDSMNQRFGDLDRRFEDINRRFADVNRRLDSIDEHLARIENKLEDHGKRVAVLEERTSPIHR